MMLKKRKVPAKCRAAVAYSDSSGGFVVAGVVARPYKEHVVIGIASKITGLYQKSHRPPGHSLGKGKVRAGLNITTEKADNLFFALGEVLGYDMDKVDRK